jgi:hypothetical protein
LTVIEGPELDDPSACRAAAIVVVAIGPPSPAPASGVPASGPPGLAAPPCDELLQPEARPARANATVET